MDWGFFDTTKWTDSGQVPASGDSQKVSIYNQLKKAGLAAGLKPSKDADALKVRQILDKSGLELRDACLLQAWMFGAHDKYNQGVSVEAFGTTWGGAGFTATSGALSAQSACAEYITFGDQLLLNDSISSALSNLKSIDKAAGELVESVGNAKAKASAKKQDVEAEKDAEKIREKALAVVSTGAISVGAIAAVAVVAYIAFMVVTTKKG